MKVIVVAREVIPRLNMIIVRENFRYSELTTASNVARMIAASPPKTKKARNIAASEKLTAKFECGIIKLNLGAIVNVKMNKAIKLKLINPKSNLIKAIRKHNAPATVTAILKNDEIFSRLIKGEKL